MRARKVFLLLDDRSLEVLVMSYASLLLEAWENMVERFEKGYIALDSEGDIRCHLFSCCLELLEKGDFPRPFEIHAEITIGKKRVDMVLGKSEVGVEIKHLKKGLSAPTFRDVKREAHKVANYISGDLLERAVLAIVDERGTARRGLRPLSEQFESWRTVHTEWGDVTFALTAIKP